MGSSKSAPAPAPDPAIGQAAIQQAQLGREYLDFQKQQFEKSEARLAGEQGMYQKVIDSQLASQDRSNLWAEQDRQAGRDAKTDFDNLSNQAQALGANYRGRVDQMASQFGGQADAQFGFGSQQRGRYRNTFAPIEDRMAKDAMEWDSAERLESEAAKARAEVTQSASAAEAAGQRQMASMGVNPNSGRFAGAARSAGLQTALAQVGAQDMTRDKVRAQGQVMRGEAVGIGQNVLSSGQQATQIGLNAKTMEQNAANMAYNIGSSGISQGIQGKSAGLAALTGGQAAAGLGLSAGTSAVNTTGAINANYLASNGIMGAGYNGAQQGLGNSANTLNNLYGNQLQGWSAAQQAGANKASGFGALLGTGMTAGAYLL